jgi:metacaspase-1
VAEGISINIGLNAVDPDRYQGWDGRLSACEFDATDMAELAEGRGFEAQLILTRQATAHKVKQAIEKAAGRLGKGDFLFLTYSGHGGQVPDLNGDESGDAQDETWVLYDRQLVDDELYALWGAFAAGVRILVLSDSCHSGSVTRDMYDELLSGETVRRGYLSGEAPRTKDLPLEVQDAVYRAEAQLYEEIQRTHTSGEDVKVAASLILISGCQDNQLSLDGTRNGLFTQTLLRVWDGGRFRGGYRRFWQAISAEMPPTQSPNYFRVGARNQTFARQLPLSLSARRPRRPRSRSARARAPTRRGRANVAVTTRLLARPRVASSRARRYMLSRPHGEYSDEDVGRIVKLYFDTARPVGLDPLLVISQMVLETGNLSSFWSQRPRRNPAGLGVTGEPGAGLSFPSWPEAVRAHAGRLLAYATRAGEQDDAQLALIDEALAWRPLPEHLRGAAPTLQGLAGTWAADTLYAGKISQIANQIRAFP